MQGIKEIISFRGREERKDVFMPKIKYNNLVELNIVNGEAKEYSRWIVICRQMELNVTRLMSFE